MVGVQAATIGYADCAKTQRRFWYQSTKKYFYLNSSKIIRFSLTLKYYIGTS